MKQSLVLALTAALALPVAFGTAQAAPVLEATVLEGVVVTPTARYTASEFQTRRAERNAVVLERVIVTPTARYSVAEYRSRQAARQAVVAVTLDAVVVTPKASYTLAEWQARRAAAETVVAVALESVVVTPTARYTLAEWHQRQAGLVDAKREAKRQATLAQRWLKAVWKHFQFARTPIEV